MADKLCPLMGSPCIEHKCAWYIQVIGKNPQSGATFPEWGCSLSWLPVLLIENSQQTRYAGAAIDSFRNEMVKGNEQTQRLLSGGQAKLIGGNGEIDNNPGR